MDGCSLYDPLHCWSSFTYIRSHSLCPTFWPSPSLFMCASVDSSFYNCFTVYYKFAYCGAWSGKEIFFENLFWGHINRKGILWVQKSPGIHMIFVNRLLDTSTKCQEILPKNFLKVICRGWNFGGRKRPKMPGNPPKKFIFYFTLLGAQTLCLGQYRLQLQISNLFTYSLCGSPCRLVILFVY